MEKFLNNKKLLYLLSFLIFGIFFFPYFNIGNSFIRIHDNLDSYFVYYHVLASTDALFKIDPMYSVDQIMNGLPRFCLPSALNFNTWIYYLFGSKTGYVINFLMVHFIGFIGMYILLKNYFIKEEKNHYLAVLTSLSFSLLPVFTVWGLSVMGQPLLLYAFLKIRENKHNIYHWLVVALFPFYSFFVFVGFFIIITLTLWSIYDFISKKRLNKPMIMGIFLLGTLYIIVDYQLFYGILFSGFESHRSEIFDPKLNNKEVIRKTAIILLSGFYHSANYFGIILFSTILASFTIGFYKKWNVKKLELLISITIALAVIFTILDWDKLSFIFNRFGILNKFSLKRFHFILPLTMYLTFSVAIWHLTKLKNSAWFLTPLLVILLILNFKLNSNFERSGFNSDLFKISKKDFIDDTFSEYFDEKLYMEINHYIGVPQNQYRILSLGISPSVLQYNGFYTLGGYQNLYSKPYFDIFTQMQIKEIRKINQSNNVSINKCYLFPADILNKKDKIEKLELNVKILRELQCKYIFSKYEITNLNDSHLNLVKKFVSGKTNNKVFLYQVDYLTLN